MLSQNLDVLVEAPSVFLLIQLVERHLERILIVHLCVLWIILWIVTLWLWFRLVILQNKIFHFFKACLHITLILEQLLDSFVFIDRQAHIFELFELILVKLSMIFCHHNLIGVFCYESWLNFRGWLLIINFRLNGGLITNLIID